MFKEDIMKHNLQGVISAIINEIVERCNAEGLKETLGSILMAVLTELQTMMTQGDASAIPADQRENYLNYFGGLAQVLLVRIGGERISDEMAKNIMQLTNSIVN